MPLRVSGSPGLRVEPSHLYCSNDPRPRRLAFTLIELVVGILLATITFGVVWGLFTYDNRRITASMERLTALRGGESILESMRTDLKNIAPATAADAPVWGDRPLLLESSGGDGSTTAGCDKVTFYRFVKNAGPASPIQKVTYRHDAASRQVWRSVDGKDGPLGGIRVEDFLLDYRRDRAGEYLVYELDVTFQGMTPMWKPGGNPAHPLPGPDRRRRSRPGVRTLPLGADEPGGQVRGAQERPHPGAAASDQPPSPPDASPVAATVHDGRTRGSALRVSVGTAVD